MSSPVHALPDELLGGGVTELLDQVLPHVAEPNQLGVQQIELHPVQKVAQTPLTSLTSALASIASTRPLVTSARSVRSVRVMLLPGLSRVCGKEEDGIPRIVKRSTQQQQSAVKLSWYLHHSWHLGVKVTACCHSHLCTVSAKAQLTDCIPTHVQCTAMVVMEVPQST